jgi:START domain
MVSVEHDQAPIIKGTVRAHTYISGYVVRDMKDDTGKIIGSTMSVLTQTDIKVKNF